MRDLNTLDCGCINCAGAACNCGCQSGGDLQGAQRCSCGADCECGPDCTCPGCDG